jgi:hypothetical protein
MPVQTEIEVIVRLLQVDTGRKGHLNSLESLLPGIGEQGRDQMIHILNTFLGVAYQSSI